jgi:hypothetical protein
VLAAEIRKFFLTNGNRWISEKEMRGRNRLWQVVFNDLIKQGFIEVKKELPFDKFKWKENWKEEEKKVDYVG